MTSPINIPTPAQMEALGAAFERVGRAAHVTAARLVDAFLELERRKRPSFTVIVPTEATADVVGRWLIAPNPVPTYFGRKRRARRARGRRIEARRNHPYVGGRIWLARQTFARVRAGGAPLPRVIMLDEIDSFLDPSMGEPWEEQADA
jgi:hypothetical protein